MSKEVFFKAASKVDWHYEVKNDSGYPGDEHIKLGCLKRIADAVEKMATNYVMLQDDVTWLRTHNKDLNSKIERLKRSNAALRGIVRKKSKPLNNCLRWKIR
jgi:hypothetical protein